MRVSVVITDGILAAAALGAATALIRRREPTAAAGLLAMASAAWIGVIRHAGTPELENMHGYVQTWVGMCGLPLIATGYAGNTWGLKRPQLDWVVVVGVSALYSAFGLARPTEGVVVASGAVAMAVVLGSGVRQLQLGRRQGAVGIAGALGIALSGLVIGKTGTLGPVLAVDVYHLVIAASAIALATGAMPVSSAPAGLPSRDAAPRTPP